MAAAPMFPIWLTLPLSWEKSNSWTLVLTCFLDNRSVWIMTSTWRIPMKCCIVSGYPISSGFSNFQGNSGELKFWGHEIALTSRNMVGEFKWTTNANITFSDNEVCSSGAKCRCHISGRPHNQGRSTYRFVLGLVQDGIYETQEEYDNSAKASRSPRGTIKFKDMNGDDQILNTDTGGDRVVIGDPTLNSYLVLPIRSTIRI